MEYYSAIKNMHLPCWLRQSRICLQCRRPGFDPWVGKISRRMKWLPIWVFLPGEFHGQRTLVGYSPQDCRVWHGRATFTHTHVYISYNGISDQIRSVAQSCPTLCDPMNRSTPGLPAHHQLPEFTQTHVHRVSDAIQPSHPLSSPSPPAPNPSRIWVFPNESTLRMRWPKYWSFSFSIIPSKEIPGLISFRMYWLDLLAVQGTLKSLLQHHSSKASVLQRSAFFTVQQ